LQHVRSGRPDVQGATALGHLRRHADVRGRPGDVSVSAPSNEACPGCNSGNMHRLPYLVALVALVAACGSSPFASSPAPDPCNLAAAPQRVQLFGGIKHPGTLAYEPGLTVFGAIRRAGGLEQSAVARQVRITRCGRAMGPFPVPGAPGTPTDLPLEKGDVLDIPVELF
jgi:SLBB domain